MLTNQWPFKPCRMRLGAVSLKYSFSYAKLGSKILSKERKCPSKTEEDMCCFIHNSHISTSWLNKNQCIFSKKRVLFKIKIFHSSCDTLYIKKPFFSWFFWVPCMALCHINSRNWQCHCHACLRYIGFNSQTRPTVALFKWLWWGYYHVKSRGNGQ